MIQHLWKHNLKTQIENTDFFIMIFQELKGTPYTFHTHNFLSMDVFLFLYHSFCLQDTYVSVGVPRDNLRVVLRQLDFEVEVYNDLPYKEIERILEQASMEDHSDADCVFVTG